MKDLTFREIQLIQHIKLLQLSLGSCEPFLPSDLSKNIVKGVLEDSKAFIEAVEGKEELQHAS